MIIHTKLKKRENLSIYGIKVFYIFIKLSFKKGVIRVIYYLIWNRKEEHSLTLYYSDFRGGIIFSKELKAFGRRPALVGVSLQHTYIQKSYI